MALPLEQLDEWDWCGDPSTPTDRVVDARSSIVDDFKRSLAYAAHYSHQDSIIGRWSVHSGVSGTGR